ncbi:MULTISPECIES: TetR/AcrR family transcriptional regulator [unclassified Paenibacillus]|uniref:TetR/AcrR family transcriptional regulator n=1 Tax=unclassified Paenibacillus TaxID=185978 RepID=UPI001B4BC608|nr:MULTISPECIES: TetR/AcrR family transcriptional regulator [unclassified Paenibacillus]MBP1154831.1 AcrR family transcriptional regulator [Paenibacillus sp. PvP091]MBP1169785.1 AcrR family transcriptional regulator [Paenibacillus sp. PvR098]MBP2440813.1 AcrR family transcriptional regulator [Paenibacillus sp. PvP052]
MKSAALIIRNEGVTSLTLEAVAKKAGISKGGLLYHFPNKDALITAMVSQIMDSYVNSIQSRADSDEQASGKWCRAYVQDTFQHLEGKQDMSTGLLAAIVLHPGLLKQLQEQYEIWQRTMENDGMDPVLATIIRLAADGLWFNEMLGLTPVKEELRERVLSKLIGLTKEE